LRPLAPTGRCCALKEAKRRGLSLVAMSPFIREWKLDEIEEDRALITGILLCLVIHRSASAA
jgi:hypothetical protein